jgi:Skp family chaperone for outer membrane proteins
MSTLAKTIVLAGVCVVLALAAPARAAAAENQTQPQPGAAKPAGQYKIAVVDRKKVFDSYEKQKSGLKALEQEKNELQKEIDDLSKKITDMKDRYDKGKETMPQEEKDKLKDQISTEYTRYQTEFKLRQQSMDKKSQKFVEQMMQDIDTAVSKIGDTENYHLILEGDPNSARAVIWFSSTIDITPQVVAALNGKP